MVEGGVCGVCLFRVCGVCLFCVCGVCLFCVCGVWGKGNDIFPSFPPPLHYLTTSPHSAVPPAPPGLLLLPLTSTTVRVAWQPYDDVGVVVPGVLVEYRVQYTSVDPALPPSHLLVQANR